MKRKRRIPWLAAEATLWVATGVVTIGVLCLLACAGMHAKLKGWAQ